MSASFTNQTLAQIELWSNAGNGKYKNEVYVLPKTLDEKVARLHLAKLGVKLTELKDEQAAYIGVTKQGPYQAGLLSLLRPAGRHHEDHGDQCLLAQDRPAADGRRCDDATPHWDVIALRVDTDAGISGWGYNCTLGEGSGALINLLERDLARASSAKIPSWCDSSGRSFISTGISPASPASPSQGVAAIEIALWDIIAKAAQQPLWRLLGGYRSDRIPAYSTDGGWLELYGRPSSSPMRAPSRRKALPVSR